MNYNSSECQLSVDGVDFPIQEPVPFSPVWYSHKFKGPGLRYEVGVCIQTGWLCWLNGSYPAGKFNDLEIFQLTLKNDLADGEKVEADAVYLDTSCRVPNDFEGNGAWATMKANVRARHENINACLKRFKILNSCFLSSKHRHYLVVQAVAVIVQSEIMEGRECSQVEYQIIREVQQDV